MSVSRSSLSGLHEPQAVHDAPDVTEDQATEEPLEESHQEHIVDEARFVQAGRNHGAITACERNEVQNSHALGLAFRKGDNGVLASFRAA